MRVELEDISSYLNNPLFRATIELLRQQGVDVEAAVQILGGYERALRLENEQLKKRVVDLTMRVSLPLPRRPPHPPARFCNRCGSYHHHDTGCRTRG